MLARHVEFDQEIIRLTAAEAGQIEGSLAHWERKGFPEVTNSIVVCAIPECPVRELLCLMGSAEDPKSYRIYISRLPHLVGHPEPYVLLHMVSGDRLTRDGLHVALQRHQEVLAELRPR